MQVFALTIYARYAKAPEQIVGGVNVWLPLTDTDEAYPLVFAAKNDICYRKDRKDGYFKLFLADKAIQSNFNIYRYKDMGKGSAYLFHTWERESATLDQG